MSDGCSQHGGKNLVKTTQKNRFLSLSCSLFFWGAAGCCRLLTPTYPLLNERLFWLQGSKPSTFGRQYTEEPVEITGKSRLSTPKTLKNTPTCPTAWCKASSRFIQGYFLLVLQRESQPGEARELWTPMGKITDEQLKLVQTQSPYSPEQVGATLNTPGGGASSISSSSSPCSRCRSLRRQHKGHGRRAFAWIPRRTELSQPTKIGKPFLVL